MNWQYFLVMLRGLDIGVSVVTLLLIIQLLKSGAQPTIKPRPKSKNVEDPIRRYRAKPASDPQTFS